LNSALNSYGYIEKWVFIIYVEIHLFNIMLVLLPRSIRFC
jgi:hypothetical protein